MACGPANDEPSILLGDVNTHQKWCVTPEGIQLSTQDGRQRLLQQYTLQQGYEQVKPAPEQIAVPTFIPRRAGISSSQIDVAYVRNVPTELLRIEEGSHNQVGTDHERVTIQTVVKGKVSKARKKKGGVCKVMTSPPPQPNLNQQILEALAKKHCRARPAAHKFVPSRECGCGEKLENGVRLEEVP